MNRIHSEYKATAIAEAQKALREYLHATKSLPFVFAELIAENSPFSLAALFPKLRYSSTTFPTRFRQILSYEPIDELEFFFESIGVEKAEVHRFLAPNMFFFSQERSALDAAAELYRFGFPWKMIGKLFSGETSVLQKSPAELSERLCGMRERYGLENLAMVGIVLAFPRLLVLESELCGEIDEIFECLKMVFVGLGVEGFAEGNVDVWYELCCKVRFFWDFGCDKRMVVDLMSDDIRIFLNCSVKDLLRKFKFFTGFGVGDGEDIVMFILQRPEILGLDMDTPVVSVLGVLEHFGLEKPKIQSVARKYGHVLGRNRMANLPNIMKAVDLHEWCFERIKRSDGVQLLETCSLNCPDEDVDIAFMEAWKQCTLQKKRKFEFLRRFGFGENVKAMKVLKRIRGPGDSLQERFDCLVGMGFKHSDICLMIQRVPEFISQGKDSLEEKVKFLYQDTGLPMRILVAWPKLLQYCLETRVKRRVRVVIWLREMGLGAKYISIPYTVHANENKFIRRLYNYHPALPKHYLEQF